LVVQPFDEWGKRDFGRPARDDHNGMLPPKLATILINLCGVEAKGRSPLPTPTDVFTLLDPFCGSGTVLTEGINLGIKKLIGTDLSDKCISDTEQNVKWMLQQSEFVETQNFASPHQTKHLKPTISIFQTDVRDLSKKINPESIDAIATEPTLGKPLRGHEKKHELEVQAKELKELFIKAFTEFYKILKPGGKIVFVIPRFKYGGEWIRIDCVEAIKRIGFTILPLLPEEEFILYARPNQHVGREIWRFQKN
jgi:tRNA G10  N-methylase Trm11